ncbi:hypothetical protein [Paenibacillus antibioticophila]|uniref:hypothetical protein n=1 Tax=Paenibacillus antibioticophila TaxID=1274374 RepID=UPI0005CA9AE5|nr:hypothetical protein [Paenibacillus antibioticophila]
MLRLNEEEAPCCTIDWHRPGWMPWFCDGYSNSVERLQVFDWKGEQVISNGITYDYDMTLSAWTFTDRLPIEKTIGRIRGDKFWGFKTWILKIEGYDSDELVMLRGMMFDAIFVNRSTDND